jgi:glycosyltransferase involved in cell wall biosynthesis
MMKKPIRVLFTIPNFITAGSGQAMLHVIKHLNRDLFSPSIAVLKRGGQLEAEIETLGIPLFEAPFTVAPRPLLTLSGRVRAASRQFRPYNFQIWHSYHYTDDYTEPLIARAAGAKGWIYTKKNMGWGDGHGWQIRSFLASRIAAQNTAMMKCFFTSPRNRKKVTLLPPGVEVNQFHPDVPPHLGIRHRLGLKEEDVLVGCVAHLVPIKGHPVLIRAFAQVSNAHLFLAGAPLDQQYTNELKLICHDLGLENRVHFAGSIKDIPALHAELDIFVLPTLSKGEGCPIALLEAMACRKPCIATNIPGSEDVIESGINGILVPPEDEYALARAINDLCTSEERRKKLGENAYKHVLAHYTIDREVAQLEEIYLELMGFEVAVP